MDRFTPLQFNRGPLLPNRVVVPPMASGTADDLGFVTKETLTHYGQLAQSGAGLVIAEYTFVHPSGKSEDNQLGNISEAQVTGLAELKTVMKGHGALAGLQLTHSGGKSSRAMTGGQFMNPSGIPVPVKGEALETPDAMSAEDIRLWKDAFVEASLRAARAGFELIEFHSAHGYGLNQFLSPLTNQRTDLYGGNAENRSRLLRQIIHEVRGLLPNILLSVRMPGQDFLEGGLTLNETIALARALEDLGVDVLHISSGIGGWRRPAPRVGEGYLVAEAERIQATVDLPVIGVGGIETAQYIDESLRARRFALAAVGRAILKDPADWGARNLGAI